MLISYIEGDGKEDSWAYLTKIQDELASAYTSSMNIYCCGGGIQCQIND